MDLSGRIALNKRHAHIPFTPVLRTRGIGSPVVLGCTEIDWNADDKTNQWRVDMKKIEFSGIEQIGRRTKMSNLCAVEAGRGVQTNK